MRVFDHLPAAHKGPRPVCQCGKKMTATASGTPGNTDACVRIYKCEGCGHEFRLMVWEYDAVA
jgi:hypothetical protein